MKENSGNDKHNLRLTFFLLALAGLLILIFEIRKPQSSKNSVRDYRKKWKRRTSRGIIEDVKTEDIIDEIVSLNLINSLYLSDKQTLQLLDQAKKASEAEKIKKAETRKAMNDFRANLLILRARIYKEEEISLELDEVIVNQERKIYSIRREYDRRIKKIIDETKKFLNTNQQVIVNEYEPCLVPKKSYSDPEKIGQSGDRSTILEILEEGRKVSPEEFAGKNWPLLADFRKELNLYIKDSDCRKKVYNDLCLALEKVRGLSDSSFAIEKGDIADEVQKIYRKAINREFFPDDRLETAIRKLLMNENVLRALKRKVKKF